MNAAVGNMTDLSREVDEIRAVSSSQSLDLYFRRANDMS